MKTGKAHHIPTRSCVSCRTARPQKELIRFTFTETDGIIRDRAGKLGGRGAYVCLDPEHLETALSKGKFVRALRISASHPTAGIRKSAPLKQDNLK